MASARRGEAYGVSEMQKPAMGQAVPNAESEVGDLDLGSLSSFFHLANDQILSLI